MDTSLKFEIFIRNLSINAFRKQFFAANSLDIKKEGKKKERNKAVFFLK